MSLSLPLSLSVPLLPLVQIGFYTLFITTNGLNGTNVDVFVTEGQPAALYISTQPSEVVHARAWAMGCGHGAAVATRERHCRGIRAGLSRILCLGQV